MENTKTALDYFDGKNLLPEDAFRISASAFSKFIEKPWEWYRQQVLNIDEFTQTNSTLLGTIVHYCAEIVAQSKEVDKEEIKKYLDKHSNIENINPALIEQNWKRMAEALIKTYILPNRQYYTAVEKFVAYDLGDNIYVGGSIDAIQNNDMIIDYKTYNSSTKPKKIPIHYKYQLLVYAWVLKQLKTPIDRIRLVYISRGQDTRRISEKTGKLIGKITEPEITILTEQLNQKDMEFIEAQIYLCKEKLFMSKRYPELRRVIWHDARYTDKGYLIT